MPLFKVKICGITRLGDVSFVQRAGADAVGLNCYRGSKRFVPVEKAAEIVAALPAKIARVGVFVNEKPDTVLHKAERLGLDYIQLHGDESLETIRALQGHAYIRVFRYGPTGVDKIVRFLAHSREIGCAPAAVLIDADVKGQFGGTGTPVDWHELGQCRDQFAPTPLILAGGLTPANVRESIRLVRPDAVDTASGVESAPGIKSAEMVEDFVKQSLEALTAG